MPPADADDSEQRPARPGRSPRAPVERLVSSVRSPAGRRVGRWLAAIAVGLIGAMIGMTLFATTVERMGPFDVRLHSSFGEGVTDVLLPPFGSVTADTHIAPLRLEAELEEVRVTEIEDFVSSGVGLDELTALVEAAAVDAIPRFAAVTLTAGTLGALVLGLLVFRRRMRQAAIATLTALVVVGASIVLAGATYAPERFRAYKATGSLSLIPQLLGPAERTGEQLDVFRAELGRLVDGAARAYASIEANPLSGDQIRVLHISDMHLSVLGFDFAKSVADGFDVDAVLDTGDVTSFGTRADQLILRYVPQFDRPYVFIRGNHDSADVPATIEGFQDTFVLDSTEANVAGVSFFGTADPLFNGDPDRPIETEAVDRVKRAYGRDVVLPALEELPEVPDVVAVHDDRVGEPLAGRVPLVVSGHYHEASARVIDGTLFLRAGTTGGAGPISFTSEGGVPLSAEILYFDPASTTDGASLVAWDVVEQDPGTGNLTVTRHLVEEEFGELVPSPAPIELEGEQPEVAPDETSP
ncbi:MAG: metallophosphoesterase [Actinomycetota bacterium]